MVATVPLASLLENPLHYWIPAWIVLLAVFGIALAPLFADAISSRSSKLNDFLSHPMTLFTGLAVMLVVFRWPMFSVPMALNADESQQLAEAITLLHDPVFPRSIQSFAIIPLYLLTIPGLLGFDLSWASARAMGVCLVLLSSIVTYFAIRRVSGQFAANVSALSIVLCLALARTLDFLHFSTEQSCLPLVAIAFALALRIGSEGIRRPLLAAYVLGLVLGALPFSKITILPVGLAIAACAFFRIFTLPDRSLNGRIKEGAFLTLGGLTAPSLYVLSTLAYYSFADFVDIFVVTPTQHVDSGDSLAEIVDAYFKTRGWREVAYECLLLGSVAFWIVSAVRWFSQRRHRPGIPQFPMILATAVLASSIYAVLGPGRGFPHYLLLSIVPLALMNGVLMAERLSSETGPEEESSAMEPGPPATELEPPTMESAPLREASPWAFVCTCLPYLFLAFIPAFFKLERSHPFVGKHPRSQLAALEPAPASALINDMKEPGDRLMVWGWRLSYHVETQLPIGSRSSLTYFMVTDLPTQDTFRRLNFEDMKKNKPAFFLDVIGPISANLRDRSLHGHETIPELATYIRTNYTRAAERSRDGVSLSRLYLRNDRFDKFRKPEPSPSDPAPEP